MKRTPIVAANWKMNKTQADARAFVDAARAPLTALAASGRLEIVLCPPLTCLGLVHDLLAGTPLRTGAQNLYWEPKGAFTGEISAAMVAELAQYVILGHSERRQFFHETDTAVNRKLHAAFAVGLLPILCIGEDLAQNQAGLTDGWIDGQVRAALAGLSAGQVRRLVIAYEPIWAIGAGRAATSAEANAVIGLTIRGAVASLYDETTAQSVRIQYGGSVTPQNAAEFFSQPDIDGALVGGASLLPSDFNAICQAARGAP